MTDDTMKIPRLNPGQYAIISVAEDEAVAWIIGTNIALLKDASFMAQVPSLLEEAQQQLRARQDRAIINM